ncbi:uncharacterized protein LOC109843334 [Asparagus officinalis]|uniref:uncharacterized protein LOC109843334 n=1 Tax=Asparagus officinalis TaxID=4686 RepID=UPI00098E6E09|nr:uncharacterized protein LOC109843334 [Asparagus officinalis]XP_020267856.1 uncharacterized protein LOC109843334 [Asparagus officinalis]XP_020267857.1 uncharacterized protein LOC109843334 [Asparagus officinalis]XP_020267858.1 uncharacterized protein LOC109843334 [Asparagus officinalis]XP_020267859.1 uncharacterized protein LOC109843334 [Asparagus officinalis]
MELDIAKMEFDFKGTPVICISGSPLILADLKKVYVLTARAVVVCAEDGNTDLVSSTSIFRAAKETIQSVTATISTTTATLTKATTTCIKLLKNLTAEDVLEVEVEEGAGATGVAMVVVAMEGMVVVTMVDMGVTRVFFLTMIRDERMCLF